jgi:hypothetical protein
MMLVSPFSHVTIPPPLCCISAQHWQISSSVGLHFADDGWLVVFFFFQPRVAHLKKRHRREKSTRREVADWLCARARKRKCSLVVVAGGKTSRRRRMLVGGVVRNREIIHNCNRDGVSLPKNIPDHLSALLWLGVRWIPDRYQLYDSGQGYSRTNLYQFLQQQRK